MTRFDRFQSLFNMSVLKEVTNLLHIHSFLCHLAMSHISGMIQGELFLL
jgi:hypothetical protein